MTRPDPDDLPQTLPVRCGEPAAPPSDATYLVPGSADNGGAVDGATTVTHDARPEVLEAARERSAAALRAVVHVPGYEVLGELGRGGMGVVYKAIHLALKRTVALKMIRAGEHADDSELARFRTEGEAVARLAHPNIVQIHEVGEHGGLPYFALEFVDGGSLAQKLKGGPLAPREAARLVETLAAGVQLAHSRNIVHRDLKPANILLTADGAPKITDFGLAKQLDAAVGQTQAGAVMGTPGYMAPEQAGGRTQDVGSAADVYALGAVLYECLTGRPPFQGDSVLDTLEQVRTQEPVGLCQIRRGTPRDLETICLKCLRKEPERRYASAEALAEDLRRWREGEPIQARPVGGVERAVKWVRRNPVVALLLAGLLAALVAGATVSTVFGFQARKSADDARGEAHRADQNADKANTEADAARAAGKKQAEAAEAERVARTKEGWELYDAKMLLVQAAWEQHKVRRFLNLENQLKRDAEEEDQRGFEWYYWDRQFQRGRLALKGHTCIVRSVAFSPDGKRIVSGAGKGVKPPGVWDGPAPGPGEMKLWDAPTGQVIRTLEGHTGRVNSVAFSADGKQVVSGSDDETVRVWDAQTGEPILKIPGLTPVAGVAISRDGLYIASGGKDKKVRVWDAKNGHNLFTLEGHTGLVSSVAFSADGARIVSGSWDKTVKLWDVPTRKAILTLEGHTDPVTSAAFSPDGTRVVSGAGAWYTPSRPGEVKLWDAQTGREVRALKSSEMSVVNAVAFSADGKRVAAGGYDSTVRVWDVETGEETLSLLGHNGAVFSVAFGADDRGIVSGGSDGVVNVWDARTGQEALTLQGHTDRVGGVAISPDGSRVVSGAGAEASPHALRDGGWNPDADKTARVWDAQTGKELFAFTGHDAPVSAVAFMPGGKRVVSGGWDKVVRLWDARTGDEALALKGHTYPVWAVAVSPDGKRIVSLARVKPMNYGQGERCPNEVKVWDVQSGQVERSIEVDTTILTGVAISPDGTRIAAGGDDGTVRVWNAGSGEQELLLSRKDHLSVVLCVAFSPNGERIVAGTREDGKVWDAQTGQEPLFLLQGHASAIHSVAISADGGRIVTAADDRTVKVWDARTGQEVLTLRGHTEPVYGVAISADGRRIVSGSWDKTVKVWDATPVDGGAGTESPAPDK